ncbi:MAG: tetratricopeptide repeat protein [Sulfurovaceae bacterium]
MNHAKIVIIFLLNFVFLSAHSILNDWSGAEVDEVYLDPMHLYEKACEYNNMEACYDMGVLNIRDYINNRSNDKALKQGIFYLDKSCGGGYVNGCIGLAMLYISKDSKQRDENKAIMYLEKACVANSTFACIALGEIYEQQKKQDFSKALIYYQKACNSEAYEACAYVGIAYHDGKKVKQDFVKAEEMYRKSISINPKVASNYINIFELQLVQNIEFDKNLRSKYLKYFKNDKQSMMYYDMLNILQLISQNKKAGLQKWHTKYKGMKMDEWNFDTIDIWINQMHNDKIKTNLTNTIEQFKKH